MSAVESSAPVLTAAQAFHMLAEGRPVDEIDQRGIGRWIENWEAIVAAPDLKSRRRVLDAQAKADPAFAWLLAGDRRPRKVAWTADELLEASFPEPTWVIPLLIPVGLTTLAGKRKVGKSMFGLQIAGAVGSGGKVFGQDVDRARVLYLALEDNGRRLQDRMNKQRWARGAWVDFRLAWDPLDAGGLVTLQNAILEGGHKLVIIDTLSRAISGRPDQMNVGDMTAILGNLQRLGQDQGAAILIVDHHGKVTGQAGNENPVDDVLGSSAKGAVADALIGLYRERGKRGAKLILTGRDLEDRTLTVDFDPDTFCWQLSEDEGPRLTTAQTEVVEALRSLGSATAARVAAVTGQERSNCHKRLQDLVNLGVVTLEGKLYKRVDRP